MWNGSRFVQKHTRKITKQNNYRIKKKKVWASGKYEEEIQGKRHGIIILEFYRRLKSHSLEICEIYVDCNQSGRRGTGVLAQISFFPFVNHGIHLTLWCTWKVCLKLLFPVKGSLQHWPRGRGKQIQGYRDSKKLRNMESCLEEYFNVNLFHNHF